MGEITICLRLKVDLLHKLVVYLQLKGSSSIYLTTPRHPALKAGGMLGTQ